MNKSGFADVLDARAVRPRSCDVYIIIGVKLVKIVKNVTHVTHVSHRDDSHKRYGWKYSQNSQNSDACDARDARDARDACDDRYARDKCYIVSARRETAEQRRLRGRRAVSWIILTKLNG